jgi:hypothetical protein
MLYKNGKEYAMTDKEKKDLLAKFTFPIYLRYPEKLIKPNRLNRLPDKPAGININLRSILNEDHTTVEWRWARNSSQGANGQAKFMPRIIPFQGNWTITEMELDLLYFLYYKSPYCGNGHLVMLDERNKNIPGATKQSKRASFVIEDLRQAASEKVQRRRMASRVGTMIDDPEMGLSDDRLRELATAYFVPNVDQLSIDQVRVVLDLEVQKDRQNGHKKFLEMCKADDIVKARVKVRRASDAGIITYNVTTRLWSFINSDESREPICKINKTEPFGGLADHYIGNREFADRLDEAVDDLEVETIDGAAENSEVPL